MMSGVLLGAVLLGACVTAQVTVAPPTHVRFDSVDYKNILRWTPPTNSTSLLYSVQWKIYGEPEWLDVDGCRGIQDAECDLSNVTSDPSEWFYARVHAASSPCNTSAWSLSPRFSPRWDTVISRPLLKLMVTDQGLVIQVKPPRPEVRKIHSGLIYHIYLIHSSGKEDVFEMNPLSHKLTLKKLQHQTKYCVQAQTVLPLQGNRSERSSKKCATTL